MTDIAIMNAGGISVPIFTTYSANDYEYILNDCKPSLISDFIFSVSLKMFKVMSSHVYVGLFGFNHFKNGFFPSTSSIFLK